MNETARALMQKSRQALTSARTLLNADDAEGNINRSYYATTAALSCVSGSSTK